MIRELICCSAPRLLLAGLLAGVSAAAFGQSVPPDGIGDWRDANDTVGQYARGHADVLKWERSNLPSASGPGDPAGRIELGTPEAAVREAWNAHRELASALATMGTQAVEQAATGHLLDIDPSVRRRVHDIDEILEVAAGARKAWIGAVAARQVLTHWEAALHAAETAGELAARMARIGNWSRLQEARVQMARETAHIDAANAGYARATAQDELLRRVQLIATYSDVDLPENLPDLPASAWSESFVQQRIEALEKILPRANALRMRSDVALAWRAYLAAYEIARRQQTILKLQEFVSDETVLHYNGMLKSVWDVLDEARRRAEAAIAATEALRAFWIAETDLQHLLLGGELKEFVSLGQGGSGRDAPAAH
ncbi:hypothetical protein [Propionivibrio sp.]|uniref:hypothetical protein n=1 Tax=Propionivibrio sp. TaxID=2212460 RepID=UPI00272E02F7|nr:hypothetical protein [Propionivibrio sp.]